MLKEFSVDPVYQTTDDDTVYSLLAKRAQRDPQGAIAEWQSERDRVWHTVSAQEMDDRVRAVARGLLGIGVKHGSMVVIYSATCYDWAIVDFACSAIGAVTVPIYETDSAKQAAGIVQDVKPIIAFAGDESHAHTLDAIRRDSPDLTYVFNFQTDGLNAVVDFGESVADDELALAMSKVKADDVSTIVYTSGSTGKPKGAMLTGRNFTLIVYAGYDVLDEMLYQPSRLLLFLPLAHCFARYIQYTAIGAQGVVGYISTAKHLLADLRSFKPTYLLGVPRVFEKVYNAYQDVFNALKKKNRERLIDVLENYRRSGQNMDTAISTLKKNMTAVLNSVEYDFSNGTVEGINRRIKSLKRSCFGFRNLDNFRKRIALIRS